MTFDLETETKIRDLVVEFGQLLAKIPQGQSPRTDEARDFIRKHENVGDFKSLAFTLILLREGAVASRPEAAP